MEVEIKLFARSDGREPFAEWLTNLRDTQARVLIKARLNRLRQGNFGSCESVGNGVYELKIFFGPGYRIYFGLETKRLVVLLLGGDKGSQKSDIERAKLFWRMHKYANKTVS